MALDAFTRELGTTQGRVEAPQDFGATGDFAFVLGHDLPGLVQALDVGDLVQVKQTADFGDAKIVRFLGRMRPPSSLPAGVGWRASLLIDGSERASAMLEVGRTRTRVDMVANVSKLAGDHELAFRLEVVPV